MSVLVCSGATARCPTVTRGGGRVASLCVAETRPTVWNPARCTPPAHLRLPRWELGTPGEESGWGQEWNSPPVGKRLRIRAESGPGVCSSRRSGSAPTLLQNLMPLSLSVSQSYCITNKIPHSCVCPGTCRHSSSLLCLKAISNKEQHSISYTLSRAQTVVVEYTHDSNTDMFQVCSSYWFPSINTDLIKLCVVGFNFLCIDDHTTIR